MPKDSKNIKIKKTNKIGKKQVKPLKKETKKKKRGNFRRALARFVVFLFILALLSGIGFGVYYFCTSSNFKIANAKVTGQKKYTDEEILKVAKVPKGKNIFITSKNKIEKRIEDSFPYIEKVDVKITGNDTLKIVITERKKKYVAVNSETSEYIRVDKHGIILEKITSDKVESEELLLFGINFDDVIEPGDSVAKSEKSKLIQYEKIEKEYLNQKIDNKITSAKFEKGDVVLMLDYKLSVIISDKDDLEYILKFLKEILKEVSGRTGQIDMTKGNPSFVEK